MTFQFYQNQYFGSSKLVLSSDFELKSLHLEIAKFPVGSDLNVCIK